MLKAEVGVDRDSGCVVGLDVEKHLVHAETGEVLLYVESDNAPAVAVYSHLGFEHAAEDTDVQYVRRLAEG